MIIQGAQRTPLDVLDEDARTAIEQYLKAAQAG
jgi:hypothetical protein